MIVPRRVAHEYDKSYLYIRELSARVKESVSKFCEENGFLFEGRIKSVESISEKIETGRFPQWAFLDDLYACTIIIPLNSDEPKVLEFLQRTFTQKKLIKRGNVSKSPDSFRFDATRFVGQLRPTNLGINQGQEQLFNYLFEVQVKSILEYAWSKTTHALTYKSKTISWKRLRLASQLKASVEQLDMLISMFDTLTEEDNFVPGFSYTINDRIKIQKVFENALAKNIIPTECFPKDLSRLSENVYRIVQAFQGEKPTGQSEKKLKYLDRALQVLNDALDEQNVKTFPRSISLMQWSFGVIITHIKEINNSATIDDVNQFLSDYKALITDELVILFPEAANISGRFVFDEG